MKGSDCKCGVSQGSSNTMRMVMLWTEMRIRKWKIQQKFGKVPTLPIESGGEEEITDDNYTCYIFRDTRTTSSDKESV